MLKKSFVEQIKRMLVAVKLATTAVILGTYWRIGKLIVTEERRLKHAGFLKELGARLAKEIGFKERQLHLIRLFYKHFPIRRHIRTELRWTHYCCLLRVTNKAARDYYLGEAVRESWSLRQLERNIASFYYERIYTRIRAGPCDAAVIDPYILEFLGLGSRAIQSESTIESAIIQNIQSFLLELGTGFAFVARQYRIKTDTKAFYIDLVFYHYLLKCFVLIDLKVTELSHQDIGQMDMYVRMFEALKRGADDQPTLGIILCKEKDQTMVKYSVLEESKHLFASSYSLVLPSEDALKAALEQGFRN
jgi:predicted nuclease of restriction endonuclease-like (RecB) superfamily